MKLPFLNFIFCANNLIRGGIFLTTILPRLRLRLTYALLEQYKGTWYHPAGMRSRGFRIGLVCMLGFWVSNGCAWEQQVQLYRHDPIDAPPQSLRLQVLERARGLRASKIRAAGFHADALGYVSASFWAVGIDIFVDAPAAAPIDSLYRQWRRAGRTAHAYEQGDIVFLGCKPKENTASMVGIVGPRLKPRTYRKSRKLPMGLWMWLDDGPTWTELGPRSNTTLQSPCGVFRVKDLVLAAASPYAQGY